MTHCLAERLGCIHTTIEKDLSHFDKMGKDGLLIVHYLTNGQLDSRVEKFLELLSAQRNSE